MKASVTLLLLVALLSPNTFAQDYTQLSLPDGATARLGKGWVSEVHYSPDDTRLAVASSIGIWLYDTATYQEIALIAGHTDPVSSVAFSPDGQTLATGGREPTIRLWDAVTGEPKRTLGHADWVTSVVYSPDERTLASGDADGTVRLWDAVTGEHKLTLGHTGGVASVAYSPDGRTLASSGGWEDGAIRLWDAVTGEHKLTLTGHTEGVWSIAFSPDGRKLASASLDETVRLWDTVTGEHKLTLTGHTGGVLSVAFSPDGRTLASASGDGTVLLWKLRLPTTWGNIKQVTVAEDNGNLGALSPSANILPPKETALLANYPNPFNPETWIPYHLANHAEVTLAIYDTKGVLVCQLDLGHQSAGYYTDRARAAYWNGCNESGESVASGVYFYQLRAGDYIALRQMVILK